MIRLAPPVRDFEQDYRDLVGTENCCCTTDLEFGLSPRV